MNNRSDEPRVTGTAQAKRPGRARAAARPGFVIRRGGLDRTAAVAFLAVSALMVFAGWLRPPLSPDLPPTHIPLGIDGSTLVAAALAPDDPTTIRRDSAGAPLLALIAAGALVVLWRPTLTCVVAGLLLCCALAASAAVALNHPVLIESLDHQYAQRQQMAEVLEQLPGDRALSDLNNGRIDEASGALVGDQQPADLSRGWVYLRSGPWLVGWAAMGLLLSVTGRLRRRVGTLTAWTMVGIGLAVAACLPRLVAEHHWLTARRLAAEGDVAGARAAIAESVQCLPALAHLERTWLLEGELDHREGRDSSYQQFFIARQLGRHPGGAAAARATTEDLLAQTSAAAIRHQHSSLWLDAGREPLLRDPMFTDAGAAYVERDRGLAAAHRALRRAQASADEPTAAAEARLYLGLAEARLAPSQPERTDRELSPLCDVIADPFLRADVLALMADASAAAGRWDEARRRYVESFDELNLPQRKNFRAQRGLGGL